MNIKSEQPNIEVSSETKEFPPSTAEPPTEIMKILTEQDLPESAIKGWYAVPTLNGEGHRVSSKEMMESGQVDMYKKMEPFLGNPILDETLRTIDILNGCGHQCDTCLADSKRPSTMMSYESLEKLFSDERFLKMLQPDSLRLGSSGDLLDHPQAIQIIEMILEKTQPLELSQNERASDDYEDKGKKGHHRIKIFTNYRPNLEDRMDDLMELAKRYPVRLRITISTPLNRRDTINKKFDDYVVSRPKVFGTGYKKGADGLIFHRWRDYPLKNIGIQDVRHPMLLFMSGRIMTGEALDEKVPEYDRVEALRESDFSYRGLAKTYLNSDALWLMLYATKYESHTNRVFTPITQENLNALSHTPYHPDFPVPPNWPGRRGAEKDWATIQKLSQEATNYGKHTRNVTVIKSGK